MQRLAGTADLIGLGMLADDVRRRRHGDRATYVQVAEVVWGDPAGEAPEAGELRLGGAVPAREALVEAVSTVVTGAAEVPVTGGDLVALYDACEQRIEMLAELLQAMAGAGLAALDEVSLDRLLSLDDRGAAVPLLETVGASGLFVNRVRATQVSAEAAVAAFVRLAGWGAAAGVCRSLAPLAEDDPSQPTTGYADLRQVALARVLVDNIDSIQVDWSRHGPKLAQVALTFGADDLDAVPAGPGDHGWRRAPREEVRRNIVAAGYSAVRRNGRFEAS